MDLDMSDNDHGNSIFDNNHMSMDTMNIYEACLTVGCLVVIFGLLQLAAMKIRDEEE